jgi:hypothetical protein
VKQEAWTKNKFDKVVAKKGRFKKADATKQNAEYTPTVNTHVIIIKNKLPDVFAKKGKFEKADVTKQNAEYTPTVNTCVNIIKNKLPDVFAKKGRFEKDDVSTRRQSTPWRTLLRGTSRTLSRTSPGLPSTVASLWVANCPQVPTSTYQPQPQPP